MTKAMKGISKRTQPRHNLNEQLTNFGAWSWTLKFDLWNLSFEERKKIKSWALFGAWILMKEEIKALTFEVWACIQHKWNETNKENH
jgi:hypothetical protein